MSLFWQCCLLEPHRYEQKSLTLVIIRNASAPRDSGQTVRLHKLTAHRAQKYSPRLKKQKHTVVKTKHLDTDTFLRHGSNPVNFFNTVVITCATYRFDGNAPQTPLSQSDILNERTLLRLQLWERPLFFGGKTTFKSAAKFTKHLPPPNPDNRCLVGPFPSKLFTIYREISLGRFLSGGSAVTKVTSSAAPAAAVAVRGSCAREGPSSSLGVVVF